MNKRLILGASLVSLLAIFLFIAGCGDGGEDAATQADHPAPAEHPTADAATEAADAAAETATEAVAMHDCAGGCGMNDMPADKMTEIDGKFYCAGCAKKVESGGESNGDG
jgi:hypothetical protein